MIVYVPYGARRVRVSMRWRRVLRAADKAKVRFTVTSGHRTLPEQQALYDENMNPRTGQPKPGKPLTAKPSCTAPHIDCGHHAHALDVNALDGGAQRLARFLRSHGATVAFPVAGEPWHLEISEADLAKLSKRFAPRPKITPAMRRKARRLRNLARAARFIAPHEGFRATPYKPIAAEKYWTIGFGHYGPDVKPGMKWSRAHALKVLAKDVGRFYDGVVARFPGLNDNQRVAITSAAFNLGLGVLDRDRSLGQALRNRKGVTEALRLYVYGANGQRLGGLIRRRNDEAALYSKKEK